MPLLAESARGWPGGEHKNSINGAGPPPCRLCARHCWSARIGACENQAMEIEDINAIGSLLADLTARTGQLRGYL